MRSLTLTWLTCSVLIACQGTARPEPQPLDDQAALTAFSGGAACVDLEQYLEDTAVLMMRTELEAARDNVPVWGWWAPMLGRGVELGGVPGTAGAQAGTLAPQSYTTTNVQVEGVDEADFVKNDGTRIFVLSGNRLHAVRSWPAEQTALAGALELPGWPRELFLDQDQLVVFSSEYRAWPLAAATAPCSPMACGYWYSNTTAVTVVDASDLAQLKVVRRYELPGGYHSARRVERSVRLITNAPFNFPPAMRWWPEDDGAWWLPGSDGRRRAAFDALIAENEQLIRAQTLAQWLPAARRVEGGATTELPIDCTAFSRVTAPTRLGVAAVTTLELGSGSLQTSSILAEVDELYASARHLYLTTRHWWWWPAPGQADATYVHAFDTSDPRRATYLASGRVDGHVVDQFSLDEAPGGQLRLATTISRRVPDPSTPNNWWGRVELTNRLTAIGQRADRLVHLGHSADFAAGERITSARFTPGLAYVATFRNVDPLFVFDVRDARAIAEVGELKVPGFSTYIHPLDERFLLTIGTYVPETCTGGCWQERALQLSLFDVSDSAHPALAFTQRVGTASSYSEAQWEHRAFNWYPEKKLLAVPFSDWGWSATGADYWARFVSDLRVFSVDTATGFTPRGALSMSDLYRDAGLNGWDWYYVPAVRRSVMADDFVYAISDSGLRVANLASLGTPLATMRFQPYRDEPRSSE